MATTISSGAGPDRRPRHGLLPELRSLLFLLVAFVVLCLFMTWAAPNFLSESNFINILRQMSMIAIIGVGMTMVIVAAEIDLSVGSMAAFGGVVVAWLIVDGHLPIWLSVVVTLAMGALISGFIGLMRVWFRIPSFITSLALLTALSSAAYLVTDGFPISPLPPSFSWLHNGMIGPVPVPVILMLLIYLAGFVVMRMTAWGRAIYAVGGNEEAARLSGISIPQVKIGVFLVCGALAAFAGIVTAAKLNSGSPTVAKGWELDVIAAVIIGGTSLFGGAGSVVGTLVGALFMATLKTGMVLMGVSPYSQGVVSGLVILLAVLFGAVQLRRRR